MTDTDRIAQMAREAELIEPRDEWGDLPKAYTDAIIKLIGLVAEDCAKVCEDEPERQRGDGVFACDQQACAQAIRARYSKEG